MHIGGHAFHPASLILLLLHRTKQRFREETFFGSTLPGALKAKEGMSDDSFGDSRTAHVRSHSVEPDRGCDPSDR